MSRIVFDLALPEDEPQLRDIIAESAMGSDMKISLQRQPDFFHSVAILGEKNQIVVAREENGLVIGFGVRSLRKVYCNGEPMTIGYLSGLRVRRDYRNATFLSRGYRYFHQLHGDKLAPFYLSTIIEGNEVAMRILTSGRAGLPVYRDMGRYHTLAIPLNDKARVFTDLNPSLHIRHASECDIGDIVNFANSINSGFQFAPYLEGCFLRDRQRYRDLQADDFIVAIQDGEIVGCLSIWNQDCFKQNVVMEYGKKLSMLKPFLNVFAQFGLCGTLPDIGSLIGTRYVSFMAVDRRKPEVLRGMLARITKEYCSHETSYLLIGLHESDPFGAVINKYRPIKYASRLYQVYWQDESEWAVYPDGRMPFQEVALL